MFSERKKKKRYKSQFMFWESGRGCSKFGADAKRLHVGIESLRIAALYDTTLLNITFPLSLVEKARGMCPSYLTQKRARLLWSQEHVSWANQEWRHVHFPDESRFSINSDSYRVFFCRAPGIHYHPSNIREFYRIDGCGILV
ncbi:hypothetical protein TNCV_4006691 [Trichonephila clavipes]|nr:hypothetical protein TNCV_4006691 [Trichonephila clavipes]